MSPISQQELAALVDGWVSRGILDSSQAAQIRADMRTGTTPQPAAAAAEDPRPSPLATPSILVEALGYVGGAVAVAAVGLIVSALWSSMTLASRAAIAGTAAFVLVTAGALVPARASDQGGRLRAIIWAGAVAAVAATVVLLLSDGLSWDADTVAAGSGLVATSLAAGLWAWHRHPIQHLVTFAATLVTVGASMAMWVQTWWAAPLLLWVVSLGWTVLCWLERFGPRIAGLVARSVAMVGATVALTSLGWGVALGMAPIALVVSLAVLEHRLSLLAVGALGTVRFLPQTFATWFEGMIGPALGLLVAGLSMVAAAVVNVCGRRAHGGSPSGTRPVCAGLAGAAQVTEPPDPWSRGSDASTMAGVGPDLSRVTR